MDEPNTTQPEPRGVSRRNVMKGAAWSVPVIAVASAAPSMASSPEVYIDFENSTACKIPGSSMGDYGYTNGYVLFASIVNNTGQTVYIKVDSMALGAGAEYPQCIVGMSSPAGGQCPPSGTQCMEIPVGTKQVFIFSNASDNAANTTVTVGISWYTDAACSTSAIDSAVLPPANLGGDPWSNDQSGGGCTVPGGCNEPLSVVPGSPCDLT